MHRSSCSWRPAALAAAFVGAAAAQQPPAAPPPPYRSVLDGYRRFAGQPVAPWRQSNDSVGPASRAEARDRSPNPAEPPKTAASAPAPGAQGGHGGQHH